MSGSHTDKGISTICVHAGKMEGDVYGSLHDPIYMTSNYQLPTDGSPVDWSGIHSNIYARNGNPNQFALQRKLAAIEGAEDCVVMGSGVAALAGIFLTFLKTGDHVVCSEVCYSAVGILFRDLLPQKFKIEVSMVDSTNLDAVKNAVRENTALVHIETPGNPTTGISDLAEISKIAKTANALLSVDSTFASPLYLSPLSLGADLVMHSMTKYINGHGDSLGGCVLGSTALIDRIKEEAMVNFGGIISPFNAWLVSRGLVTLPLRMRQHNDSAQRIAEFLERHPGTRFVRYPGLKSHPQHALAKEQMRGKFSGMMSFDIKGSNNDRVNFLSALKLVRHAVSLGDGESLIVFTGSDSPKMPYYPEIFRDGFFRFSVGLEDADDIIADIENAFMATPFG